MTKRITRYGNYLTMVIIVEDPVYLDRAVTCARRRGSMLPNRWSPRLPASPLIEGTILPAGTVPSYLPGQNDALWDFAIEFGIPPDATQGGAETTYPEYVEKMKTMKKLPRTTTTHYQRQG